jgi:hypothetical protein
LTYLCHQFVGDLTMSAPFQTKALTGSKLGEATAGHKHVRAELDILLISFLKVIRQSR